MLGGSLAVRCAIFNSCNCPSHISLVDASLGLPGVGHGEVFCVEKGRRVDAKRRKT